VKGVAACSSAYIRPTTWALIGVHQELDSVQIQSAMANSPTNSNPFLASGRKKFNLNLRSQGQVCHGKQAHANIAEIDAKSIQVGRLREYLHRGVQQLAFPASPVWFEAALENHPSTSEDTVAQQSSRAKITDVQWNVEDFSTVSAVLETEPQRSPFCIPR
jgi:hypothetical protein